MKNNTATLILSLLLIILGASARLLPHPANFTPIAAIAIFSGIYLPKKYSFVIPFAAMILSDAIIGFYSWKIMAVVYVCFGLTLCLATIARQKRTLAIISSATLFGSIIFFLGTNAAVWAFGTIYAKTFTGLVESYIMALPFFRNSLIGDFFFTGLLVGGMEAMKTLSKLTITKTISN